LGIPVSNDPALPAVLCPQWYLAWYPSALEWYLEWYPAKSRIGALRSSVERSHVQAANGRESQMLGTLLVIALLLLLFGVIGGIAISKFLFLVLIVAAVVALFAALSGRSA
jgi:hypothetical protein